MEFDFTTLPAAARYKILGSAITPRPIAWVTTRSVSGVINAAPFSFFNVLGSDPPLVAIGLLGGSQGPFQDTGVNIADTGEFVVNLVSEADSAAMNVTCMDAPPEVDEAEAAGLQLAASTLVTPPRIASAPASFECREYHRHTHDSGQIIILGEVVCAHVRDEFVIDAENHYLDTEAMDLVARMHGRGIYARTKDLFEMARPTYADWVQSRESAE